MFQRITVGEQISSRMAELGISIKELAFRLEVHQQTIRYWLSGDRCPRRPQMRHLERELCIAIDWTGSAPRGLPAAYASEDAFMCRLLDAARPLPLEVRECVLAMMLAHPVHRQSAPA